MFTSVINMNKLDTGKEISNESKGYYLIWIFKIEMNSQNLTVKI